MTYIITKDSFVATWDAGVEYHPGDIIPAGAHQGWKILCAIPLDAFRDDFADAVKGEIARFQWDRNLREIPDDLRDEIGDAMDDFSEVLIQILTRYYTVCRYLES